MADIIKLTADPVKPSFEPRPDEVSIGAILDGLVRVYASKERVLIMFADPRDPGNPQRRTGLRFRRQDAADLATLIREAVLTVRST